MEFVVATLLKSLRLATGKNGVIREIHLASPRRNGAPALSELLECTVHLGAQDTTVVFDRAMLDTPILFADDVLLAHLTSYGTLLLSQRKLSSDDLAATVQLAVLRQLSRGSVTRHATAEALGVSERTLARRLAEIGQSFREITEKAREQLARTYLADPALAIAEIAYMLGYVDQSSFSAAFRRWTGLTPARYRQGVICDDDSISA